jgi:outer membrane lipoprotein-sorting protein
MLRKPHAAVAALMMPVGLMLSVGLTGCFSTRHAVQRTQVAPAYRTATVEQLEEMVGARDASIRTLNATVLLTAQTGGGKEGQVTEYTSLRGHIFVRKPSDLRVLLQLPVVGSRALDMVSNGSTFTLMRASAHGNIWVTGSNAVTSPSKNGLENLRPPVFFDSLLVPGVPEDEFVTVTEEQRTLPLRGKQKVAIVEPDYDLTVFKRAAGNRLQTERVIHISRVDMLPFQQDIYDAAGRVVTTATYAKYEMINRVNFPTEIDILRPLDEYSLKMEISQLVVNGDLADDQFMLTVPVGVTVTKLP